MVPSLQPGDFIFTNMNYNCPNCLWGIERGDVAVFVFPNNRTQYYIKRIVGIPGDEVSVNSGVVSINGKELGQIEANESNSSTKIVTESIDGRAWEVKPGDNSQNTTLTVKPGHVFVLGDNRSESNDSRQFDQVPLADVVGRARQVWFSMNKDGIQWDRIGRSLIPAKARQ